MITWLATGTATGHDGRYVDGRNRCQLGIEQIIQRAVGGQVGHDGDLLWIATLGSADASGDSCPGQRGYSLVFLGGEISPHDGCDQ